MRENKVVLRCIFIGSVFGFLSACTQSDEESLRRGSELLLPFKQGLQQALRAGMQQGPVEAISACRVQAPIVAADLSRDGVVVGRSSHRLRNPANQAPDWVAPIMASYVESSDHHVPQSVQLTDARIGYVEPIVTQALCLTCHGEQLAPELAAKIEDLYPQDRATGFRDGDLRGVFWVEFPQ